MARKKVIFSFFSGSGFLDLGFETNGFKVDLVNEYSSEFMRAYKYSREKMGLRKPRFGYFNTDINEFLNARKEELQKYMDVVHADGDLVGFIGGPPCPDFSIAGKNRGRNGDNGKLSKSYVDLIITMRPDFFLFENVKGLWKTARHREFYEELKSAMISVGYVLTDRLTNALEFGAPQDRDRILLFGIRQDLLTSPESIMRFPWDAFRKWNAAEIKALPWPITEPFIADSETACPKGIPEAFTVEHWFRKNDVEHQ